MLRNGELLETTESIVGVLGAAVDEITPSCLEDLPRPQGTKSYHRVTLHRTDYVEVAAARWREGGESTLHGHGCSAAIYTVVSGSVEEQRFFPEGVGYRYEKVILGPGDKSYLPPGSFHSVRAINEAVTVHSYSPPPENATSCVPGDIQRMLHEAKSRCTRPTEWKCRPVLTLPPVRQPDLVAVVKELLPGWAEREVQANQAGELRLPPDTIAEMRSSGILTAPLPVAMGGWDASLSKCVAAIRLIAQQAPATALALVMPLGNAATTRIPEGALGPVQRPKLRQGQAWIAEQVKRGMILAVANSEPGSSGELKNTKTVALQGTDGVYRLTGRKSFATFGRDADYFLCAARHSEPGRGDQAAVVDGFFVAKGAPGLTVDDKWNPIGMRPTASVGLTLEGAPAEAILGYPGCLEGVNARHWSTILFAAVFLGVGEACLREGVQQTAPDAQWAQATLADCALQLDAAAGFVETVARDERWPLSEEAQERARRAKSFVAKTAVETATHAAMVSGGRCYTPNHPVFRYLCDALAGPLLRPPLPKAMDAIVKQLFPTKPAPALKVAA